MYAIPHYHTSYLTAGVHRVESDGGNLCTYYTPTYWPGDTDCEQLVFALKYEGINLALLAQLFQVISAQEVCAYVQAKPTGKYARRLWFLYEYLTGQQLDLPDLKQGNYLDLLEPEKYYTRVTPLKVSRQRINNNLLGNTQFCPLVRRTPLLQQFEQKDLSAQCQSLIANYNPQLLKRALSYLYTRETRSSFEIEHESPSTDRQERFIRLLQLAEKQDFCEKSALIELQNRTVDPRFQDNDYRTSQNYVGESVHWQRETIHFVAPKPEDLTNLMAGLIAAHQGMIQNHLSPVIHAAIVAYGFVFLHPFEDGNGRIHRFLFHNILAIRQFTPQGIMFPVSAVLLKESKAYESSLDAFSRHLMPLVDYSLDELGQMRVHNPTALWYRYIDFTSQAEALFQFIEQTLEQELKSELEFLLHYDQCKQAMQMIVDLPDRQLDLLIKFLLQNRGELSQAKRRSHFPLLTENEITAMEQAFQTAFSSSFP